MSLDRAERRLSAILSADVVGYSRLMAEDEVRTVRQLSECRRIVADAVGVHGGRVVDAPGDNILAEFPSASAAVACAVDVQGGIRARNEGLRPERRMELRIGVHVGEVLVEGQRIYGAGINIAARLEALAEPGGILVSGLVHDQVKKKIPVDFVGLGRRALKNIPDPVRLYGVQAPAVTTAKVSSLSGRVWIWGIAAAVLVAFVIGFLWATADTRSSVERSTVEAEEAGATIAVLPFRNLSPDPENDYFSAGITEELIGKLWRVGSLRVAARTSVARFKDTDQDIKQVGEALGVRYVLDGGVRKVGDRVRITAQLVDCSSGFQLWSADFNGNLKDIFAAQEETAVKIAEALDLKLSPREAAAVSRRYTDDVEAYDAYLRGWTLVESLHSRPDVPEATLVAAEKHFTRALEHDPDYALALAGLAVVQAEYVRGGIRQGSAQLELARTLAQRAIDLDEGLPQAWAALGTARWNAKDYVSSLEPFRESLRLEPGNAYVWCEYAGALNSLQTPDLEAAEAAARNACRLEPLYPWSHVQLANALRRQGRFGEAIETYEYAHELNPEFDLRGPIWLSHVDYATVLLEEGDEDRALAQLRAAGAVSEAIWGNAVLPLETLPDALFYVSRAYAAVGNREAALDALDRALAHGFSDVAAVAAAPEFASLRSNARLKALLARERD